jgi:hypothetical protein
VNSIIPGRKKGVLAESLEYLSKNRSAPVFDRRDVSPVHVPFVGRSAVLISEFHAAVESRGDGLHPMLRTRQAIEMTRRVDGMLQAGPSPASEASLQEKRCDLIPASHPGQKLAKNANAPSRSFGHDCDRIKGKHDDR